MFSLCALSLAILAATIEADEVEPLMVTHEAWFDVSVRPNEKPLTDMDPFADFTPFSGRFTIALFGETLPISTLNFQLLTQGYNKTNGQFMHYKNTPVTRVVPDFVVQMGDVVNRDGTGSESVFGARFDDESFKLSHRSAGWVSLANHGPNTNGCQFFILLVRARWLDNKHVVFGKVIRGFDIIHQISELPAFPDQKPRLRVQVEDCGIQEMQRPYELPKAHWDSTKDFVTPANAQPAH